MSLEADILIVGAGMAGTSLAAELAPHASVILLEGEAQPGYHSTGRSAAFWSETYGGPLVQPLTTASGPFLSAPPSGFADRPFLSPRGAVHIAERADNRRLAALRQAFAGSRLQLPEVSRSELDRLISGLRAGWDAAIGEPTCADIDVAALHAAYLKSARAGGVRLLTDAPFERAHRTSGGWVARTAAGEVRARVIVDAAGAWADEVAERAGERPVGIKPYRRTIAQLRVDPPAPADLPLVLDAEQRFYFKPEAGGRIWLSPHDETQCDPCDCAHDDLDVALAIDRLEQVVDWRVERVEHSWAGLRSFAPDRLPVYGFAPGSTDFFWFAGQGGFGIQTAPAAAKLGSALLLGRSPEPMIEPIDPTPYLAARFAN